MQLAWSLDSRVCSAERFRSKNEPFQTARQLLFERWRNRDFAVAALKQILCLAVF
jgi:hypothetical protein